MRLLVGQTSSIKIKRHKCEPNMAYRGWSKPRAAATASA